MDKRILVTGGAGFIGSHLCDALLALGWRVRALDSLAVQVHGRDARRPAYLDDRVELIVGDVRDREAVRRALADVDAVVHFAAAVGVGQSMYQIADYTSVNNLGTATLLEEMVAARRPFQRLVVASSMSVYGEGLYTDAEGQVRSGLARGEDRLAAGDWEVRDAAGRPLTPVRTPESKEPSLASVYALSKFDQERLCLMVGRAYGIPAVALRFFNVYGTRQALSNPYTGVMAIFAARLLNGRPPVVFEDGLQRRDFVDVRDVARATALALEVPDAVGRVLNVGSGESFTVLEVADRIAEALGRAEVGPEITGQYRVGDIRHCFADIEQARRVLGYRPRVAFADGLRELAGWLAGQVAEDRTAEMRAELAERGLTLGGAGAPAASVATSANAGGR